MLNQTAGIAEAALMACISNMHNEPQKRKENFQWRDSVPSWSCTPEQAKAALDFLRAHKPPHILTETTR